MNDIIRREDAIIALLAKGQKSRRYKLGEVWELNFDEIREALATVSPAEPVKHGKWIMGREKILWDETDDGPVYMYSTTWTCSECGYRRFLTSCPDDKFCKECGTKMDL